MTMVNLEARIQANFAVLMDLTQGLVALGAPALTKLQFPTEAALTAFREMLDEYNAMGEDLEDDDGIGNPHGAPHGPKNPLPDSHSRKVSGRARNGVAVTAQEQFRPWIREALEALGGEATRGNVLLEIRRRHGTELLPADFEPVRNGDERWANSASFQRKKMVRDGLLDPSAPYGIWRLL
jgi:hypothetical protein